MKHFFSRIQLKTKKKKVFTKTGAIFSPNSSKDLRSNAHPGAYPEIRNGDCLGGLGVDPPATGGQRGLKTKPPAAGDWGFGSSAHSAQKFCICLQK